MTATPTYRYRGRRWFQAVIGIAGLFIMTLVIYDMRKPREIGAETQASERFQQLPALERFNELTQQYVSQDAMYAFLIALGGLIGYVGLNGAFWRGDQLILAPEGLTYYRFGPNPIDWREITYVKYRSRRRFGLVRSALIELQVADFAKIARGQPLMYRCLRNLVQPFDSKTFTIMGYDLEMPTPVVVQQLGEHLSAVHGPTANW